LAHLGISECLPLSLLSSCQRTLREARPVSSDGGTPREIPDFLCMPTLPSPRLKIFGAGDDARPLVRFAAELGWNITVGDGRSHLLRQERFPQAHHLQTLNYQEVHSDNGSVPNRHLEIQGPIGASSGDIGVILTHSYEQDRALLKALLPAQLRYLGILGPLHRTERLVMSVADSVGLSHDECMSRLHAPVGLNIGSAEPSVIALAIIAEIQAELFDRTVHVLQRDSSIPRTASKLSTTSAAHLEDACHVQA
jgi:xanthine dehydrogenase accessory factor